MKNRGIIFIEILLCAAVFFALGVAVMNKASGPVATVEEVVGGGDGTIGTLDQWTSTSTPQNSITQRSYGKPVKITGLTPISPLCLSTTGLATTTGCSTSGDGASNWQPEQTVYGVLGVTPTSSVPIKIKPAATSTFFGGVESFTAFGAPVLYATSTTATSSIPRLSVSTALQIGSEYISNFTNYVRALFTGGTGITLATGDISFDCSEVEGTGIDCVGEAITLNNTGDWAGTFDGQEGTFYLARANHTGTQAASTITAGTFGSGHYTFAGGTVYGDNLNFSNATTTNATTTSQYIGSLTGPLAGIGGRVVATSTLASNYGGTGTSTAAIFGHLLAWNGTNWQGRATSTLGIALSDTTGILPVLRGGTGLSTFGGSNTILYTSAADTLTSNTGFVFNGTNMGIGTTTPYSKLSVVGQVVAASYIGTTTATSTLAGGLQTNLLNVTSTTATSTFANGLAINGGCLLYKGTCIAPGSGTINSGTTGQIPYYAANGTTLTATSTIFIDADQQVGIGNTAPDAKLELTGNLLLSEGANRTLGVESTTNITGYALTINAGETTEGSGSETGGALEVTAGAGGAGTGGAALFRAGDSSGTAGNATLRAGNGAGGGNVLVTGGAGSGGGTATLKGGDGFSGGATTVSGGGGSSGGAGALTLNGGDDSGGTGGSVTLRGGDDSGAGSSGAVTIRGGEAGSGGAGAVTVRGGDAEPGSTLTLRGGNSTTGNGAFAQLLGGNSASTGNGGDVYVYGGTGDAPGNVLLTYTGSAFRGNVGIGTSTPYAKLSVVGQTVSSYFTATSTTATSTFPMTNVTTAFQMGSDYITDLTGTGLTVSSKALTVDPAVFLTVATAASTYTPMTRTISTTYPIQGGGDLSANRTFSLAFGTTTANIWGAHNIFSTSLFATNATTTNATTTSLYIGSLTGPLQAIGGQVSATSTIQARYGGLGTSTPAIYGQLLSWTGANYQAISTSTLGINLSDTLGTLPASKGGTGAVTLTGVLVGNGTSPFTACTSSQCISDEITDETGAGVFVMSEHPIITESLTITGTVSNALYVNTNQRQAAEFHSTFNGAGEDSYVLITSDQFSNYSILGARSTNSFFQHGLDSYFLLEEQFGGAGNFSAGRGNLGVNQFPPEGQTLTLLNAASTDIALVIKAASSQTKDLIQITNSSNATSTVLTAAGNFGLGTTSPYAKLSVVGQVVGSHFTATSTTATSTFNGGVYVAQTASSTAPYVYSKTAGFGGHIIMEDEGGGACTELTTKAGTLNARVIACPTEI